MKIQRTFPTLDYVDVECQGEVLKVKYRYPTLAQEKILLSDLGQRDSGAYGISVLQYCVDDIQGLVDENDQAIKLDFIQTVNGREMKEESVMILHKANLDSELTLHYHKFIRPSPLDKKK